MIGPKWACEGVKPLLEWPRSPFTAAAFPVRVADCHGYVTVGENEDCRPGALFLQVA